MSSAAKLTSARAAAAKVGITANTVENWMRKGWLPEPPWTSHQVTMAQRRSRQRAGEGSTAAHGTPARYRAGCPCDACRDGENSANRGLTYRRAMTYWAEVGPGLLGSLAGGVPYREALKAHGVTAQALTSHRHRDRDFAARLDEALMAGRDPDLDHGRNSAWKARCRCPECREFHQGYADRTENAGPSPASTGPGSGDQA